jgi:hypothetical protein
MMMRFDRWVVFTLFAVVALSVLLLWLLERTLTV